MLNKFANFSEHVWIFSKFSYDVKKKNFEKKIEKIYMDSKKSTRIYSIP